MIAFRDKFIVALLVTFCVSPALGQSPERPAASQAQDAQARDAARTAETNRRIRSYLNRPQDSRVEAGPATGEPLPIQPEPYIPPQLLSLWQEDSPASGPGEAPDQEGEGEESVTANPFEAEREQADTEESPAAEEAVEPGDSQFPQAVETGSLSELDPASLGTLRPDSGGLPADIWAGTERPVIAELLRRLPVGQPSPAINQMLEKLLLSAVEIPPAQSEDASDILAIRIEKLAETGKLDLLLSFLAQIAPNQESERVRLVRVNAYLLDGNVDGACSVARSARTFGISPGWVRILAFCDALAGDENSALRSVSLLEETGASPPGYRRLIEGLLFDEQNDSDEVPSLDAFESDAAELAPLYLALYARLNQPPPVELVERSGSRLVAASFATRSDIPPDLRLPVAIRAATGGYYSSENLGQLLMALDYTDADNPLLPRASAGETGDEAGFSDNADPAVQDMRGDGYLLLSAFDAADIFDEAKILGALWRRIVSGARVPLMAGAMAERVGAHDVREWPNSFQRVAFSTALYAGRRDMAERSYRWLQLEADGIDLSAGQELARIWPLAVVAQIDPRLRYRERDAELWWRSMDGLDMDRRAHQATVAFGLLEALGYRVPQRLWDQILLAPAPADEAAPPLGIWRQLLIAGDAGRTGEAMALSTIALGDQGPAATGSTILSTALGALSQVGLDDDARQIALEAMVVNGVGINP